MLLAVEHGGRASPRNGIFANVDVYPDLPQKLEFKVLTTSRWGTVETLKHDCLTDDVEFGDFPIFRFQINYGLGASSLCMSTKLKISTGGNFQTRL